MLCENGCKTLSYRGESPLSPSHFIGRCISCGATRHGHRINWRSKVINGKLHMVAREEKKLKGSSRPRSRPKIDISAIKTPAELLAALKKQGVKIT